MSLTKKEQITGISLSIILLINTLIDTYFFLGKLKVSIFEWIAFNACSPISFIYLICFAIFLIKKKEIYLTITILPIYYLGTMAMLFMPWNGESFMPQFGHIIMTLNLIWVLYVVLKNANYKALGLGLLISILFFSFYIGYVQTYNQKHQEQLKTYFYNNH